MDNRIVLVGAGGHAKSVIGVLLAEGRWRLTGLLVEAGYAHSGPVLGFDVIGDLGGLSDLRGAGIDRAIVAIGDNLGRGRVAALLKQSGFSLVRATHPMAVVMTDASVGEGSCLHAYSVLGPESGLGDNAIVQPFTSLGHESRVGRCVQFSPGVHVGGRVRIGDDCFFGPGAVVFPNVTIGRNVSVGANSVINKDVPDNAVIAGNPARVVRANPRPL